MLKQQRMLLYHGHETTAEVISPVIVNDKIGNMFPILVWLRLRKPDGSYTFTDTYSLVSGEQIPGTGQLLRIKYMPDNISVILIL